MRFNNQDQYQTKLTAGVVKYRVDGAVEGVSKKGNSKLDLKLTCRQNDGTQDGVFKSMAASYAPGWEEFFKSCGHPEWFESGELAEEDFIGLTGYAYIVVNDKNRAEVDKFLTLEEAQHYSRQAVNARNETLSTARPQQSSSSPSDLNDDIPF